MNRAFHDARLASTTLVRSPWALSSPRGVREERPSLTPLSPRRVGSFGATRLRRSGSAKITACSAPRERWQSVRDPRRLPSIEPTLRYTSRCLSEGHAISQVLPPGFAFRPSVRERPRGSSLALVHRLSLSRSLASSGTTSSIDFCSYDTLVDTTPDRKLGPRADRFTRRA